MLGASLRNRRSMPRKFAKGWFLSQIGSPASPRSWQPKGHRALLKPPTRMSSAKDHAHPAPGMAQVPWSANGAPGEHEKASQTERLRPNPTHHLRKRNLVPGGGLEPPQPCGPRILSPLRLPISPSGLVFLFLRFPLVPRLHSIFTSSREPWPTSTPSFGFPASFLRRSRKLKAASLLVPTQPFRGRPKNRAAPRSF